MNKTVIASVLKRIAVCSFTYRIPVYLMMFLLMVAPLRYRYAFAHPEIIFVALCFSSLMAFIYLLNKVTDTIEDAINVSSGPIGERAARPTLVVAMVCFWLPILYLVFVPVFLPLYGVVALLGFYYSRPLPFFKKKFRLKQVLFVKNIISALIWSLPPVGIQLVIVGATASSATLILTFCALFCVFFTFESLWDIRDMEGDRVAGVHTIANTYGVTVVRIIGTVLLGVYALLVFPHRFNLLFSLGLFLAVAFVWTVNPKRGAWFYYVTLLAGVFFLFFLGFTF